MLKNYYKFGRVVQVEMSFKEFSIFSSGGRCSADLNHLHNFGKGQYGGHSCELFLISTSAPKLLFKEKDYAC